MKAETKKYGLLDKVEKIGNKLPHPIALFAILAVGTVILSCILANLGVSVVGETLNAETGQMEMKTYTVVNMISRSGLAYIIGNAASNFTSYAPLAPVLVAMLGIGVADNAGYISAVLKKVLEVAPAKAIVPILVFSGVMSNVSGDAGYVIVIPIGMMIMHACGRHPLAGLAATLAGVSGGYSANMLLGLVDAQLAGITQEAAHILNPEYEVSAACNWYFMAVSTILLTIIGTIITEKIVEPRLGVYTGDAKLDSENTVLSKKESGALKKANLVLLAVVLFLVACAVPQNSFLRNADSGSLISNSPLMSGLTFLLAILFFTAGVTYGANTGYFKNHRDVCKEMGNAMSSMGSYLALAFVAAQFIKYFSYSNIGNLISIAGADFLMAVNLHPMLLIICFILFCALMNFLMASATAKWTLLAPIFVPMLMKVGISPELAQVAYRIGDSSTNIVSPVMAYLAVMIIYAQKYEKNAGLGTIWSMMIPYSIAFLSFWSVLLLTFMALGLPLGPGIIA